MTGTSQADTTGDATGDTPLTDITIKLVNQDTHASRTAGIARRTIDPIGRRGRRQVSQL